MSVTPLAARVSTNASEGVIFCGPTGVAAVAAAAAAFWSDKSVMAQSPYSFMKNRYILFRYLKYILNLTVAKCAVNENS
jgi:hypothetical protein